MSGVGMIKSVPSRASAKVGFDDPETEKPGLEGGEAVDPEGRETCQSRRLNVDRSVVEERDLGGRDSKVVDDVLEDGPIGFDLADFVRKKEGFDRILEPSTVEWRVELIRVAQSGDSVVVTEPHEKGSRLRGRFPRPLDELDEKLCRREIDLQFLDHTIGECLRRDLTSFETPNRLAPDPAITNLGPTGSARYESGKLVESSEVH